MPKSESSPDIKLNPTSRQLLEELQNHGACSAEEVLEGALQMLSMAIDVPRPQKARDVDHALEPSRHN